MCQELEILMALKRDEKITALFALNEFGCFRLSARIENLRKQGYSIRTEMVETESGKRVAEYSMEIK